MDSPIKELYLIGNGFDMHHDIRSGYGDFKLWLQKINPVVFNRLFQVYDLSGGDLWKSLEENLGRISIEAILENYVAFPLMIFIERADGESSFFNLDDFSNEVISEVGLPLNRLYFYLENYFQDWISQLNNPNLNKRIQIKKDSAFFINFNYTTTLETTYAVPENKICYIHGCAKRNQHLVFGHNKTSDMIKKEWNFDSIESDREELEEAIDDIITLYKDVNKIIIENKELWNKISDVEMIHVWGLSLSDVDLPYIKHINLLVELN